MKPEKFYNDSDPKPKMLYHGSPRQEIEELKPRIISDHVFAASDRRLATVFMNDIHLNGFIDGEPYAVIKGTKDEFVKKDKGGSVYSFGSDDFEADQHNPGLGIYVSSRSVRPTEKIDYPSGLQAMLENGIKLYFVDENTYQQLEEANQDGREDEYSAMLKKLTPEKIGGQYSEKEKEELSAIVAKRWIPRKEYSKGEIKLNFAYTYVNGDRLVAREDEDGIAHIVIERNGKELFDFKQFAGEGYVLVTPSNIKKQNLIQRSLLKEHAGTWVSIPARGEVLVGDMRDPTAIFALLHETGHSKQDVARKIPRRGFDFMESNLDYISHRERDAWADALSAAREIKEKYGTDLFEAFRTIDDLTRFVHASLYCKEFAARKIMGLEKQENPVARLWNFVKEKLFEDKSNENAEFIRKVFDKGRLGRKLIGQIDEGRGNENSAQ